MSIRDIQQQISFNVLLIGDSCTDEYKIGTVDRLSPEAPVPVIKIVNSYDVLGMAANVNLNLINLNINANFITNTENITKTRYIDQRSGQHLLRVDNEPSIASWNEQTTFPIDSYNAIIISDYNKGFLSYEHIKHIIQNSKCPVFIDTKKTDLKRFDNAYVKINDLEYRTATSLPNRLIVTKGGDGAMYNGTLYSTKKVEVTDVCGAGDTFLAALTVQYLYTKDIEKAIIFANIAAGITVQHRGNYAPTYNEIKNAGY